MLTVCGGDGGKAGSAAFAGGGSGSRQSGAAQPAGGGEEVGGLTLPISLHAILLMDTVKVRGESSGQQVGKSFHVSLSISAAEMLLEEM